MRWQVHAPWKTCVNFYRLLSRDSWRSPHADSSILCVHEWHHSGPVGHRLHGSGIVAFDRRIRSVKSARTLPRRGLDQRLTKYSHWLDQCELDAER